MARIAGKLATQKADEAFDTIVDFLVSFESLSDTRQRGNVLYPLDEFRCWCCLRDCWLPEPSLLRGKSRRHVA
jgi:hypothetical protein